MRSIFCPVLLGLWMSAGGCIDGEPAPSDPLPLTRPVTDRTYLRDAHGRYLFFQGINVSGSSKIPTLVDADGHGTPTYVGKPFPLEEADRHFEWLQREGFNAIRLLVIWEGLEPRARGEYDIEYLEYLRAIVERAGHFGIYVLLDMHQDIFSRHLMVRYNHSPSYGEPGSIENTLLALVPDEETGVYNDTVQGDGAPRWAVQACLQEKDMDSPHWGIPRILSGLSPQELTDIYELYKKLAGIEDDGPVPEWVVYFLLGLPGKFPVSETSDLLPFTFWGLSHALSLDVARCYACLFAGRAAFPDLTVEGQNVQDYLQEAYAAAWAQVARRVADQPNVLGYDLMNEPSANFLVLSAAGAVMSSGAVDGARGLLQQLLGPETGDDMYEALVALRLLPPDASPETLAAWGLAELDPLGVLALNVNFNDNYLRPFYEKVAAAILVEDPDAVIAVEAGMSAESLLGSSGLGGMWVEPMTRPAGVSQLVFAPHWYADIYPFIGFNQSPREFSAEEVRYRDYRPGLETAAALATEALGNPPVLFGEFGTYFNFNGIEQSQHDEYLVSAHVLDNYFEALDGMFASRMLWCYSPENDWELGDLWNHEDFSIADPRLAPRGADGWRRVFPRALAGKPIAVHYSSPLHYFDPDKAEVPPVGEFELVYGSRETDAPSEIGVPAQLYPDGFYVWISDGSCAYDPTSSVLYHLPGRDEPGVEHRLRLLPPLPHNENTGWQYFFRGDRNLVRN